MTNPFKPNSQNAFSKSPLEDQKITMIKEEAPRFASQSFNSGDVPKAVHRRAVLTKVVISGLVLFLVVSLRKETQIPLITFLGCTIIILGNFWFTYLAFKVSALWGLAVFLIPFVSIMFLIRHWERAKWAWWFSLSGLLICFIQNVIKS
jgi:hypothetical protein